jgi:hypothetical protein
MQMTLATLNAMPPGEADFYLARLHAKRQHLTPRCYGVSSDALVEHVLGLRGQPLPEEFPLDSGDLDACKRSYDMAPDRLKPLMDPILAAYTAAVADRYPSVKAITASV